MTYRTLILVGKLCNMRRCSYVGQHMEYAGNVTLQNKDENDYLYMQILAGGGFKFHFA